MGRDGSAEKAILIAGPTASGKSAVALDLARTYRGTVINADSVQVYADLALLSSRPDAEHCAAAPHLLFGHVDGAETHSVGRWLAEVEAAIRAVRAAGRIPVVVGGTGLYHKALTQGLSAIPAVPDAVRTRIRAQAKGVPAEALHTRLAVLDPASAARLRPTDPQRILRALEVFEATGQSLTHFQGGRKPPILGPDDYLGLFVNLERAALNARIDGRFDRMLAEGALAEVGALRARGLDPALPVMRALGVPSLMAYLNGDLSIAEAAAAAKLQTRQYAKRQVTFARHQLPGFTEVRPEDAAAMIAMVRGV